VVLTDIADEFTARGVAAIEKNLGRQVEASSSSAGVDRPWRASRRR
jgi:hypothetical protein